LFVIETRGGLAVSKIPTEQVVRVSAYLVPEYVTAEGLHTSPDHRYLYHGRVHYSEMNALGARLPVEKRNPSETAETPRVWLGCLATAATLFEDASGAAKGPRPGPPFLDSVRPMLDTSPAEEERPSPPNVACDC
jgi:hypothetical protein